MKRFLLLLVLGVVSANAAATSKSNPSLPSDLPALEARIAAEPTNVTVLVWTALEYHNRAAFGRDNTSKSLDRAKELLAQVLQQEPHNTFARVLLGSTIVVSARDPFWPGTRIRRVREGLGVMDAALEENSEDPDARFTRASNNLFLPDRFDRKEVVQNDFEWLQERADRQEFASDFRQSIYLYHGYAYQHWGDSEHARRLWEAGLAIDPESKVAEELRNELMGKSHLATLQVR